MPPFIKGLIKVPLWALFAIIFLALSIPAMIIDIINMLGDGDSNLNETCACYLLDKNVLLHW